MDTSSNGQGVQLGVMKNKGRNHGFIRGDDGSGSFVHPSACENFSYQLPTVGTRLMFRLVNNPKTCKTRADAVSQVAAETDDNGKRHHVDITEATQGKLGNERRCEQAKSSPKADTNDATHLPSSARGRPIGANPRLFQPDI